MPELKEASRDPTLGHKVLDAQAIKDRDRLSMYFGGKKKQDEIEVSIAMRVNEGNSVTHQVKSIEKSEQIVFKLKVKGPMPELKDASKDPTLGFLNQDEIMNRERKSIYLGGKKRSDEIEESLNKRVSEGNSFTHQVRNIEK